MDNELNKNNEGQEQNTETPKTYTQEEVNALLQSESDRRVTEALKKAERKQQEQLAERLKEAEKVAKMNAAEKYAYELEQREKEVAAKEKALALAEMKNETSKILSEKGLSLTLVDLVVNEDAEITNNNISILEKAFNQSVKAEVEKRLASKTPTKSLPMDKTITKEEFKKLSYAELLELKNEQPELYAQLIG